MESEELKKEKAALIATNIERSVHNAPRITRIEEVHMDLGSTRNKVRGDRIKELTLTP